MAHLALVETIREALQGVGHAPTPQLACRVSSAIPSHPATRQLMSGCPTLMCLCDSVACLGRNERWCWLTTLVGVGRRKRYVTRMRFVGALVSLLRRVFGPWQTVTLLHAAFYSRMQSLGETLAEYSSALNRLHQRI